MTRVFVLTNHKGGVGKSTSATTIALVIAALLRRMNTLTSSFDRTSVPRHTSFMRRISERCAMTPLATYISELVEWQSAVTPETGHYPTLNTLLAQIGQTLSPKVIPAAHPIHFKPKTPDFGLFSNSQPRDQMPDFGVVEVKKMDEPLGKTVKSLQVDDYLRRSNKVLVTNFYQFVLVIRDEAGNPRIVERPYELAKNKQEFLQAAAHPQTLADKHEADLADYLKRVLGIHSPLTSPQQVAWMLASYAHRAAQHLEDIGQDTALSPALTTLQKTLEDALQIEFSGANGPHFFRSTLVQTLFYGVFAAWVVWHDAHPNAEDRFDLWRDSRDISVPVIQDLFYQFSNPTTLKTLGLATYLQHTADALNRVQRDLFFKALEAEHAIQHFYEPFLEAFDPQLRKDLGVWYTPPEIVRYMVQRVDHVLQTELNIADGLADPNVVVLDPCCGTGAYLLEVMRVIYERLRDQWGDIRAAEMVQKATRERLYGFEIMPAAFIVAHLQIALKLTTTWKAKPDHQRVGVYLTNALTDWVTDPDKSKSPTIRGVLPALTAEQDAAREVKQSRKILVIIGNPPYNAFAGTATSEREKSLVNVYKKDLREVWGIKKYNLDDLYVRFFRLAEHAIAELNNAERGVVCYISSFSYLSDPSYVVMRQRFLNEFGHIWIDSLNGDSRETGKRIPAGLPNAGDADPSVFTTTTNKAGIKVGTSIGLFVRTGKETPTPVIHHRDLWGKTKREDLLASLKTPDFDAQYTQLMPHAKYRYKLRPLSISDAYESWPRITELSASEPLNGPIERRGNSLIVFNSEKDALLTRLTAYLDAKKSDEQIRQIEPRFMKSSGEFDAPYTRSRLVGKTVDRGFLKVYPFKPFDIRVAYLDADLQPLFSRPNAKLIELMGNSNKIGMNVGAQHAAPK